MYTYALVAMRLQEMEILSDERDIVVIGRGKRVMQSAEKHSQP
jgi:hypothetical protein